jgi:hypothetical protein
MNAHLMRREQDALSDARAGRARQKSSLNPWFPVEIGGADRLE